MRHPKAVLVAMCCALLCCALPACQAAQPALSGRRLSSANWGSLSCPGLTNIGFGPAYQAVALPTHGLILGQVQIHNRGPNPIAFQNTGFRLSGAGGPLDGSLKCPQRHVPAGGVLQCGFVAAAPQPLSFTSFRPFLVPQSSGSPCFCQQPYSITPFFGPAVPATASSQAAAFSTAGVAQSFADACAKAFGGPAFSEALSKAKSWQGDAFSLANSIADSVFAAGANANAAAQATNGIANAQGNALANAAFGPASASSSSAATQTGASGAAIATDKATAVSGSGPAQSNSQATAFNAGGGPAVASSSATAASG